MNLITDNQTESFIAIPDVLAGSRSSFLQDGGGTGNGISPEILEQVENVPAQDPEVFTTSAVISQAMSLDLKQPSDVTVGNKLLDDRKGRVVAVSMGHGDSYSALIGGLDDLIRLSWCAAKGFFDVEPPGS